MNIIFYNHFGNGDLIESRQFALAFMRLAGVKTAYYAHKPQYAGSFEDLPQLEYTPLTNEMNPGKGITVVGLPGSKRMFVNTWVGRGHDQKQNGYVLQPGVGCVLERIHQMWNDLTVEAGLPLLPGTLVEYLPVIDYTQVHIASPLRCYLRDNLGRKLVLICNGKTTSNQCSNFDYAPILDHLPRREDLRYLLTERVPLAGRSDVEFTDDLTQREHLANHRGWDLTAISYLSRYCDVIVGRCSGAQMYAQVLENWMDSRKTLVCLTYHRNGACFVRNPESLGLRMRVLWSSADNAKGAAEVIEPLL